MAFLLIGGVVGVISGLVLALQDGGDTDDKVAGALVGCLIGVFLGLFVAFAFVMGGPQHASVERSRTPLVALQDTVSVQGRFFLGSGSINGELVYVYYYETEDGGIRSGYVSANRSVVYEEDRADALVVTYEEYLEPSPFRLISGYNGASSRTYKIYVPKGTVVRSFQLDLEQ
jgi:hypothetical protein